MERASDCYPTPKVATPKDKFSFRPQHPGETDEEYADHKGKAQKRFDALDRGRSGAVRTMMKKTGGPGIADDSSVKNPYEPY